MLSKKIICVFTLSLLFLTAFSSNISVSAFSQAEVNPFTNRPIQNKCTKAVLTQRGKVATWTCSGDGLFYQSQMERLFGGFKTKVNTRAGEMK
jgi:hypothetical protein